jgi:microcystin-dependent protein
LPSPVGPNDFCSAVPSANADFCTRFSKFLNVPQMLCDLFSWMLDTDGSITTEFKAEVAQYSTPTGMLVHSVTLNMGEGWLLCDGSEVSRTTYANLFAQIGTRYGAGNGTTTFALPDCRGRSIIGAGSGTGLTTRDINTINVGEESHTMTESELVAHVHEITSYSAGGTDGDGGDILNKPDASSTHMHDTESTGGGTPFNVVHPCFIAYTFVKT